MSCSILSSENTKPGVIVPPLLTGRLAQAAWLLMSGARACAHVQLTGGALPGGTVLVDAFLFAT